MEPSTRGSVMLAAVIVFQAICAAVFAGDVLLDLTELQFHDLWNLELLTEAGATMGLIIAIVVELRLIRALQRRNSQLERSLDVASGALQELMQRYFTSWGLTTAEQDVATFTIKGFSIAEIAELRGSREATIKTHLNAIYRKSGCAGRGQLVSLLIEDLLRAPLVQRGSADSGK